ncbi:MAG TPA: sugar kinase, partial [Streptosporangiaceae bacterium]|nr:sugar kinase [Streptosporangiaceae bacterium]
MTVPAEVVTFGETMAALRSARPLRLGGSLGLSVAGAESNVAIGLARLGHRVAWIGRVGDDEPGALVLRTLRAENIDVGGAVVDRSRPTGLILFERRLCDVVRVQYYRSGSAGGALRAADLPALTPAPAPKAAVLHITGITPALGPDPARATVAGAERARDAGHLVSFDVNYRARLWSAPDARASLRPLAAMADFVFGSEAELALLTDGTATGAAAAADELLSRGTRAVVVKRGAQGATSYTCDGVTAVPAHAVRVIDVVGAGDAFVSGYLSGVLDHLDEAGRLR